MNRRRLLLGLTLLVLTPVARAGLADEPSHLLCASFSTMELLDKPPFYFWSAELRPAWNLYHLRPWLVFGMGEYDTRYAAAGVLADIALGERWRLTPGFGGGYYDSNGLELGHHIEFRSSIELSYRFRSGHRLGVALAHLSNGSIGDRNPGTETLGIVWCLPLR